jgi:hypothetical protein
MNMKLLAAWLSLAFFSLACWGQTGSLQMDIASGLKLSTNVEIINQIPNAHLKQLPKTLLVYRYSGKPYAMPLAGLKILLGQSAFAGTNLALLHNPTNASFVTENVRLVSHDAPPDIFSVNLTSGDVLVRNEERGKTKIPQSDTIPSCEEIQSRLLATIIALGINTNEIELSTNGTIRITCGDTKTSAWNSVDSKRVSFVSERGVGIQRGLNGYSSWLFDDKIIMEFGTDNRLLKFSMHWPDVEPVRTNRLASISEIVAQIKNGRTLTDATDVTGSEIAQLTLKDIEIQYYYPPTSGLVKTFRPNVDIYPIAAIITTFKSKTGQTEDAGIYLPILGAP